LPWQARPGAGSLQVYWTDDKWIAILPDLKKLTSPSKNPVLDV